MFERKSSFGFLNSLLAVAFCLSLCATVSAQSTATLQGTVTDPQGAVLNGAKVTVHSRETGTERTAQTDEGGSYQFASLQPGTYSIEVQAQGFQTHVVSSVSLEVARTVVQNFQLTVGSVSQTVTVVSDAPVIETATTSVGTVINQRTVQEIPLNGRHFVDLGLLIPGSVTPPQNGFLTAPLRGQGSFAFNTAGNREDTVNFQINGVNLNDMVQNQITFQPSINTVSEFKADNSTFSAEYGRNSGAVVNIATRSGSNEWHGELFEYLRNDALDARNLFNSTLAHPPPFKRNQFGGNLGGPIMKEKAFFFFSYEGLRQRQGLSFNTVVLDAVQRAGVTDAISQRLLPFIPLPNSGTNRFVGSGTAPVNIDQWTGDVSYNLTKDDRLHGYYAFQRDLRGEPNLQGNSVPGFGDTRQSHRQIFTFNETHTFGPTIVNEARFGFNRIHITFTPNALLNPADLGINVGINQPIGIPQITVGGTGINIGGPSNFPQGRSDTTFVTSDTLNYLRGNHSFKFGGEFRRFYNNNFTLDPGAFAFGSVAAFQTGLGNAFNITLGDRGSSIGTGALGLFVQDNYKPRSNLTLELGVRYDWNMTPTERFDRFVVFDPSTDSLVRVGQGIGELYRQNNKNIEPRVGLSWSPFGDDKTVVRTAYAIMVDQPVTNSVTGPTANPPLATPLTFAGNIRLSNAQATAAGAGLAPNTIDHDFRNAYVQSWNLNVQRAVTPTLGVMLGYFGSKGTHLRISRNLNQFVNGVRPFPRLSASSPILPGAALGNITQIESTANSSYNAMWATADKRLARHFQFNASYTWSKSIDYNSLNSQGVVVQDSYNLRGDRGLSDYDARHRFVISGLYELPLSGNRLYEGWQLGTIFQVQSGNPVNILAGNPVAIAGTGIGAGAGVATFTGLGTVRPDLVGPVQINGTINQWFTNTVCDPRGGACPTGSVFALPVRLAGAANVYHFGSLGRNVIIGPGFNNLDFSVIKNTKLTEAVRVQFRAEFFDLFNHANLGQPGRTAQVGSATFGLITNTRFATGDSGSSRQIQFALKLLF
ncbi:MAG: TonB-dependent receptor domain-containing protein [Pyrinomonadaceae bacterium]